MSCDRLLASAFFEIQIANRNGSNKLWRPTHISNESDRKKSIARHFAMRGNRLKPLLCVKHEELTKLIANTSVNICYEFMWYKTLNAKLGIMSLISKFTFHILKHLAICLLIILHSSMRKDNVHRLAGFWLAQSLLRSTILGQLRGVHICI